MHARFYNSLETGDILLAKNFTTVGWLIGNAFRQDSPIKWCGKAPKRPSGHNGILGRNMEGEWVVFEAQPEGFISTLFKAYLKRVNAGECELKVARIPSGLTDMEKAHINTWCLEKLGTPYDYKAYVSLIWRSLLRLPYICKIEAESCFYCTEAVQAAYKEIHRDFTFKALPSPFTIEKRISQGKLCVVAEYWDGNVPEDYKESLMERKVCNE